MTIDGRPWSVETDSGVGAAVIHGFTSNPGSVQPLAQALARSGWNLEVPLLAGHGRDWSALNKVRYQDWLADVEAAHDRLRRRCDLVFAVGQSMGGALSLHLAQTRPDLAGLILINPILLPPGGWKRRLLPLARFLPWGAAGVGGDTKDRSVRENSYTRTSFNGAYQLVKLLDRIRPRLNRVTTPTLIMNSPEDHVVPPSTGQYILDRIPAADKSRIWLNNSYHVAAIDFDKDLVIKESLAFIKRITGRTERRADPDIP